MPCQFSISKRRSWPALHLLLGLGWIALILLLNPNPEAVQLAQMLLLAGWLPSIPVAILESRIHNLAKLILFDCLISGLSVLLILFCYLPLFYTAVIWFLPLVLLPRGLLTEMLFRILC